MSFTSTSSNLPSTSVIHIPPSKQGQSSHTEFYGKTRHSAKELYNWSFTASAVASCSIYDALQMPENKIERYDFFWLGRVPCTSIKIVGMVVGLQIKERKIIYTVDDGTGVIDCHHTQPSPAFFRNTSNANASLSKYQSTELEPSRSPEPICGIGSFVRLSGRLIVLLDSRQVTVKIIEKCSANDELTHIRTVRDLHKNSYFSAEPFKIPASPIQSTPKKAQVPVTPSTRNHSRPSSVSSSPIKSEEVIQSYQQSPIKLRHPSRLHTHDLTENTFRIYLKHYMDHAPIVHGCDTVEYDSDTYIGNAVDELPRTPTKNSRFEKTPRQRSYCLVSETTPLASIRASGLSFPLVNSPSARRQGTAKRSIRKEFSLSYLRRVPELSLLASRVVSAVGRRKLREERRRLKEAGFQPSHRQKAKMASEPVVSPGEFAVKKKRLFKWAVVQLLKEGCIVLWDGPVRACTDIRANEDTSRLWRSNVSTSVTLGEDSALFSLSSGTIPSSNVDGDADDGAISDPNPHEEAYISLTADYLAEFVENAVKILVKHNEDIGKPYSGASKEAILGMLKRDDRWQHVGVWNVDDALAFLQAEGRVWAVGKNRWDVTE